MNRKELYEQLQKTELRIEEMRRTLPEATRYGFGHVRRMERRIDDLDLEASRLHGLLFPMADADTILARQLSGNVCVYCHEYVFENADAAFKNVGCCPRCNGEPVSAFDPNWTPALDLDNERS